MFLEGLLTLFVELLGAFVGTEFFLALISSGVVFGAASLLMYFIRGDKRV